MKFLLAAAKIFLYILLIAGAVVGAFWLSSREGWPWWMALVLLAGVFGLVLFLLFLKRWFFRRRERKFVKRVIDQDKERIEATNAQEARSAYELQERWRQALRVLKESRLSSMGNPLYALPWYLLMGPPGSGKTTAVKSARLHSPLTDVTPADGISATRNCDWWFLDDAVIMDTAGRYATSVDQTLDREEWREFLTLLTKHRKKEPISGFVVTIGAERLFDDDMDAIVRDARSIRRRADELMRALGATFPVYVLITKTDRLMGMKSFSALLNKGDLNQAMGWMNDHPKRSPEECAKEAVDTVADRLKDLRIWLADRHPEADPALVLLPQEINALKPGLARFSEALFESNPFQETPFLRGIYFGSGRQEGDALPHLPKVLEDFRLQVQKRPDTHKGLFLHDFFSKVLPGDRRLYSPLFEFVRWRTLTHAMGMTAALAVILCFIGLISFSYIKNRQALLEFTEDFHTVPELTGDLRKDLILMDDFREELFRMKVLNRDWLLPRMGFDQSLLAEHKLEGLFTDIFRKGLLSRLDLALDQNIAALNQDSPEQQLTRYIAHIVGRINLIDAQLSGADPEKLQSEPMPDERVFTQVEASIIPEVAEYFDKLYTTYLELTKNQSDLLRERQQLMGFLRSVLKARQTELYWLVDWANDQPDLDSVTMAQFWGLTAQSPDDTASVPPAYTLQGKERIDSFLKRVETALQNEEQLDKRVQTFRKWYLQQYANSWQTFAVHFPDGENWERTYLEWKTLASSMASEQNPYFQLMSSLAKQLEPLKDDNSLQMQWVQTVMRFASIQNMDDKRDVAKAESTLMRDVDTGKNLLKALAGDAESDSKDKAADDSDSLKQRASLMDAVDAYDKYDNALSDILPATLTGDAALNMASGFFQGGGKATDKDSKSPFHQANQSLASMEHLVSKTGSNDQFVWDVIGGPLRFLMDFTIIEAAREMQNQYESIVLAAVADAPQNKLPELLFDKQKGAAWKFAEGPAKPFLGRNAAGYFAKSAYGKRFPFDDKLFRFLEQGAAQTQQGKDQYQVTIQGFPTDTNQGTDLDPYATLLTLDCAPKPQTLENLNFPQTTDFTWKKDQCGDTVFTIKFDSFDLTRRYEGDLGFAKFLKDFQYGTRVFSPSDFPEQQQNLELQGITEIVVTYSITGGTPLIQMLDKREFSVPQVVVEPWVF